MRKPCCRYADKEIWERIGSGSGQNVAGSGSTTIRLVLRFFKRDFSSKGTSIILVVAKVKNKFKDFSRIFFKFVFVFYNHPNFLNIFPQSITAFSEIKTNGRLLQKKCFLRYRYTFILPKNKPISVTVLKGQSHEINVCFFWAQWTGKILLIFSRKGFNSLYKLFQFVGYRYRYQFVGYQFVGYQ